MTSSPRLTKKRNAVLLAILFAGGLLALGLWLRPPKQIDVKFILTDIWSNALYVSEKDNVALIVVTRDPQTQDEVNRFSGPSGQVLVHFEGARTTQTQLETLRRNCLIIVDQKGNCLVLGAAKGLCHELMAMSGIEEDSYVSADGNHISTRTGPMFYFGNFVETALQRCGPDSISGTDDPRTIDYMRAYNQMTERHRDDYMPFIKRGNIPPFLMIDQYGFPSSLHLPIRPA